MSVLDYTSFHNIVANVPEQKMEPCYSVKAAFQLSVFHTCVYTVYTHVKVEFAKISYKCK
jgi:uncharacterized protein YqiB (DUF1249 family)